MKRRYSLSACLCLATGSLGFGNTIGDSQNRIAVNGGNSTQNGNDVTIDGSPALAPRASGLAVGIPMADAESCDDLRFERSHGGIMQGGWL
jgi:hypothetical protein